MKRLISRVVGAILICASFEMLCQGPLTAAEPRKTNNQAAQDIAIFLKEPPKPLMFRRMDISPFRVDDFTKLNDIYDDLQIASTDQAIIASGISLRKGVKVYKIAAVISPSVVGKEQKVYYAPDKDVFYIQYRGGPFGSATFYGPFKGDPAKKWDLGKEDEVPQP
jgi:hypothetical protein